MSESKAFDSCVQSSVKKGNTEYLLSGKNRPMIGWHISDKYCFCAKRSGHKCHTILTLKGFQRVNLLILKKGAPQCEFCCEMLNNKEGRSRWKGREGRKQ